MSPPNVGRNDPCPCGSGKKYKKCCMPSGGGEARTTRPAGPARPGSTDPTRGALMQAGRAHAAGRAGEAARLYQQVLRRNPREHRAMFALGRLLVQRGDLDGGERLFRQATQLEPTRAPYFIALADTLYMANRLDESIDAAKRGVKLDPRNVVGHCIIASTHERRREYDKAICQLESALRIEPDHATAVGILARVLRRLGRNDEAKQRLESLLSGGGAIGREAQQAWHELGHVLQALGEYDAAFDAFRRSGELLASLPAAQQWKPEAAHRRVELTRARFDPARLTLSDPAWFTDGPGPPVFLVGFPRSGTTMTEQMLAAHPGVVTSDERPLFRAVRAEAQRLAQAAPDGIIDPERLDQALTRRLRRVYFDAAALALHTEIGARRLLDKLPLNIISLPSINAVFPDAKVIVLIRDPRDVCWSCFTQDFRLNHAMSNFITLEGTVDYYDRVMGLWLDLRDQLTIDWREFRYEDIARRFDEKARELIEFIDLPWNDDVLRFHEQARERAVATPSYNAVSNPVNTRAIGRWRNYASHFDRYQERLQPYLSAFGYDAEDG